MAREVLDVRLISATALAKVMRFRQVSVRDLARRTGAHRATIGHLRSGKRTYCDPLIALRIAEQLDYPIDGLFEPLALRRARHSATRRAAA